MVLQPRLYNNVLRCGLDSDNYVLYSQGTWNSEKSEKLLIQICLQHIKRKKHLQNTVHYVIPLKILYNYTNKTQGLEAYKEGIKNGYFGINQIMGVFLLYVFNSHFLSFL